MQLIIKDIYNDLSESAAVVYCYECVITERFSRHADQILSVGFETDDAEVIYCAGCNTDLSVTIESGWDHETTPNAAARHLIATGNADLVGNAGVTQVIVDGTVVAVSRRVQL